MKKLVVLIIAILIFVITFFCILYNYSIGAVSKNSNKIIVEISENSTYLSIGNLLKEKDLIKSELFYKLYIKLNKPNSLQAGKYVLNQNMNLKEIIEVLENGSFSADVVTITFKEGINMRKIAKLIEDNTNNTIDDVYNLLKEDSYLDRIIDKYWFIDESIKNKNIYYSLEGYLFPDTYEFDKNFSVEQIFDKMLQQMDLKLSIYKEQIQNSSYSTHQLLTLASIVELEAANSNDRNGVAGVFYNRLNNNWSLGSDVTTYYAIKVDMNERDLYQSEIDDINSYNTRPQAMAGKLPVGPICIPSNESIEAVINPKIDNYFFFVADKNKKTYFSITYSEHEQTIAKLKSENLWYNY